MLRKGLAGVEQISGEEELGSGDVPETVNGKGSKSFTAPWGSDFGGQLKRRWVGRGGSAVRS